MYCKQLTLKISFCIITIIILCQIGFKKMCKSSVVGQQILIGANLRYFAVVYDNHRVNTWQPMNSMCHQHSCLFTQPQPHTLTDDDNDDGGNESKNSLSPALLVINMC